MAVIVKPYSETDGLIAYASSVMRYVDDLYTLQAGNINSANLAASGVGAGNLETSSVISRAVNGQAITFEKLDYEAILTTEVF